MEDQIGFFAAMKVPSHEYDQTVKFYRDIIGLSQIKEKKPKIVLEFGDRLIRFL